MSAPGISVVIATLNRRTCGRSLGRIKQNPRAYLLGCKGHFRLADTPRVLRQLDKWIRHRLRAIQLKKWRRGRTFFRELVARGLSPDLAAPPLTADQDPVSLQDGDRPSVRETGRRGRVAHRDRSRTTRRNAAPWPAATTMSRTVGQNPCPIFSGTQTTSPGATESASLA